MVYVKKNCNKISARTTTLTERRMKRMISGGAGFLWEGEGFFINDYKKKEEK